MYGKRGISSLDNAVWRLEQVLVGVGNVAGEGNGEGYAVPAVLPATTGPLNVVAGLRRDVAEEDGFEAADVNPHFKRWRNC